MFLLLRTLGICPGLIQKTVSITLKQRCSCTLPIYSHLNLPHLKPVLSHDFEISRTYAKGRDKPKEKGKKKVVLNESLLEEVINLSSLKEQMSGAVEKLKEDFIKNLSLRSSAGSLEGLKIEFEDEEYALQDIAQISRKNPKTLIINMSSFPQLIPDVLKALSDSGMNVNPQQEGTTLIIPIPKVTKEHREGLVKNAKVLFIKCRDNIRDVQNKFTRTAKNKEKSEGLSQDDVRDISDQLKILADQFIEQAEKMTNEKQNELKGDAK